MNDEKSSRRDFISKVAPWTFWGSLVAWSGAMARFTLPSLLPQATKKIKIGMAADFPPGSSRQFAEDRVALFSDEEGIYAISTTCTHLGCVVQWTGNSFECPCHGSRFGSNGEVERGPAPKGLPWHKIEQLPSGQLAVDLNRFVPPGKKASFNV